MNWSRMQHRRNRITVALMTLASTWLISAAGGVWWASSAHSEVTGRIEQMTRSVDDHETRLRVIERVMHETANDVQWIREHLAQGGSGGAGHVQ